MAETPHLLPTAVSAPSEPVCYSDDQDAAYNRITELLAAAGVDVKAKTAEPKDTNTTCKMLFVIGKAGSGKTMLLADIADALVKTGVEVVSGETEVKKSQKPRTLAILAPTNKAASVLRQHGVEATTLHRIIYTPLYNPDYERIVEFLERGGTPPEIEKIHTDALTRAAQFFKDNQSVPGALAILGVRGADFIIGWERRDDPLDIGFVDESSMLDDTQLDDLKKIFTTLVLFGDPSQLAPVGQDGEMIFNRFEEHNKLILNRIHRQAKDNPILDIAHALGDPDLGFGDFENMITSAAGRDERVIVSDTVQADLMARSPVLVWRNATRIRLIEAFRRVHKSPDGDILEGEPLMCDGIELPRKLRHKRMDLQARGLIKGAQCIYLGRGGRAGFARVHILGVAEPDVSVSSIIKIESPNSAEPMMVSVAHAGAVFVHGAACTIHKAQGSQWPDVQVFAPDLYAAFRSERMESGLPLWKRLAYVAVTRAQNRLFWVKRYRLSYPKSPLSVADLRN